MSYEPRLTAPSPSDLRYINVEYGGYNECMVIDHATGLTMPNCTGYVHGRVMEILGTYADPGLYTGNAYNYYGHTEDGYERTYEPQLGGILCFSTKTRYGGPSPGHVCIVEEIIDADTIRTSDSNYGLEYFETPIRKRSWGWNRSSKGRLDYQGCIIIYREGPTPPEPWTPTEEEMMALYAAIIKKKKRGEHL